MSRNWRDTREEEWVPPSERIGENSGSQAMARIKMFEKQKQEPRQISFTKQSAVISNPVPSSKSRSSSTPSSSVSSPKNSANTTSSPSSPQSLSSSFAHLNLDENYEIVIPDEMYGRKLNEAEKLVLYKQEEEKMNKKRKINEAKKAEVRAAQQEKAKKVEAAKKKEEEAKRVPVAALGSRFAQLTSTSSCEAVIAKPPPVSLGAMRNSRQTVSTPVLRFNTTTSSSGSSSSLSSSSRNTASSLGMQPRSSTVSLGAGNDRDQMRTVRSMTSNFQKKAGIKGASQAAEKIATPTTTTTTTAAAPVVRTGGNSCAVCDRPVYAMEMIKADKLVLHKWCFRCHECNMKVTPGNYAAINGTIFCKPHFTQLFKLKGNYDEGFGGHQRKYDFIESNA